MLWLLLLLLKLRQHGHHQVRQIFGRNGIAKRCGCCVTSSPIVDFEGRQFGRGSSPLSWWCLVSRDLGRTGQEGGPSVQVGFLVGPGRSTCSLSLDFHARDTLGQKALSAEKQLMVVAALVGT